MGKGKPTPYDGLVKLVGGEARWTGAVAFDGIKLAAPLSWRAPRRIFVNSMSDLFHESLTNEQIAAVFGVMAACPQHTFQCLTKRAGRMREWFTWLDAEARTIAVADPDSPWWRALVCVIAASKALGRVTSVEFNRDGSLKTMGKHDILIGAGGCGWPLTNVWPGVSVEDRKHGVPRIDELRAIPAAVRMLSCEPMLEDLGTLDLTGIGWVIAGCESGPGMRPMKAAWVRSIRDQCASAGVAFFLKQAVREIDSTGPFPVEAVRAGANSHRKPGGVIGLPYLDGVQHKEFPR
jgi:protein gp37